MEGVLLLSTLVAVVSFHVQYPPPYGNPYPLAAPAGQPFPAQTQWPQPQHPVGTNQQWQQQPADTNQQWQHQPPGTNQQWQQQPVDADKPLASAPPAYSE
ncbi:hypothetical protein MAR_001474 [Mya arenaria]|uniref:Uncharacterized protein n=1 Tax=Mya arenaria TaxID=6604 RepID=A0ABY7FFC4_MYAAR|nr:hypothetical protein MAR_001474 [Mya arenaria]